MRRLIRKIINWAYGENFSLRVQIIEVAKINLALLVHDIEMRSRMDYDMLNDELCNIKHILTQHDKKFKKQ